MTNVILLGSNFMSAQIAVSLLGHDDTSVTVVDRKDPLTIRNVNQDMVNIVKKYCLLPTYQISYRDEYEGTQFGDDKRKIFLSFIFKDWVHEDISDILKDADVIIHSGCIYDTIFSNANPKETLDVNINGTYNIISQLNKLDDAGKLFLFMSSINVYGDQSGNKEEMITEDGSIPNPKDLLNLSLYTAENIIKSLMNNDNQFMIFRLGTLCGYFTPHTSLVTAANIALLDRKHHPEFTVYNGGNSIELLDMNDLGMLVNNVYSMYKAGDKQKYELVTNHVYNIKAEEKEEKNVRQIVEIIMTTPKRLPVITKKHGIKGINNYQLKAPKIVESLTDADKPFVKFGKPVSGAKARENLNFLSMKPLSQSLLTHTISYVLMYILADIKSNERQALAKMFYLPSVPSVDSVDDLETEEGNEINKEVKKLVSDTNKAISNAFDNSEDFDNPQVGSEEAEEYIDRLNGKE
jgi:nucleoside-diphosphate-sugar epimerase